MYRLFSKFCPALRSGYFIEENSNVRGLQTGLEAGEAAQVVLPGGTSPENGGIVRAKPCSCYNGFVF